MSAKEKRKRKTPATRKTPKKAASAQEVTRTSSPSSSGTKPLAAGSGQPAADHPPPVAHLTPDDAPLPAGYGHDRIAALVRDPHCVYTYWDLTGDTFGRVVRERGDQFVRTRRWALRINDLTHGSHQFQEVAVEDGNWYLHVEPGTSYSIDIGLLARDGSFLVIASSNVVATPRDTISDRIDEEWVLSESDFERLFDLSGGNRTIGASESISSVGLQKMRERIAMQLKQAVSSPRRQS